MQRKIIDPKTGYDAWDTTNQQNCSWKKVENKIK